MKYLNSWHGNQKEKKLRQHGNCYFGYDSDLGFKLNFLLIAVHQDNMNCSPRVHLELYSLNTKGLKCDEIIPTFKICTQTILNNANINFDLKLSNLMPNYTTVHIQD